MANIQKLKLKQKQKEYNNFSNKVGIHTRNENLGGKLKKKAENTEKSLVKDVKIGYNNKKISGAVYYIRDTKDDFVIDIRYI